MSRPRGGDTSKAASVARSGNGGSRSTSTSSRCSLTCLKHPSDGISAKTFTSEETVTYYGAKELASAFRTVRNNTIKIAEEVPEDKYDFRPAPDARSIRDTLVHIALSTDLQSYVHRNNISDMQSVNFQELMQKFGEAQAKPRSKADIVEIGRAW